MLRTLARAAPAVARWTPKTARGRALAAFFPAAALAPQAARCFASAEAPWERRPSGLLIQHVVEGTGEAPEKGQEVTVHYTGSLRNGQVFDCSRRRGEPISFQLGAGQVIQGWDEGIALLKVGGRANLEIPPGLGYGSRGTGPIPPHATLLFDVQLVSVGKKSLWSRIFG
mmetsp:Transcript_29734/g.76292  ORF Transcript_29734/g.76292 Transcript_29734/m.76292 type:complete len:170 (-) Transcript_29734:401-910(-)